MSDSPDLVLGLVYYAVFLIATTLHEAAHAWAALRGGDSTAYHGGQVSLDPLPHIRREPFGMVVLPILSVLLIGWPFGFASAPYNIAWARKYPRRAAWMALAGPAANFTLMLLAGIAIRTGIALGYFTAPNSITGYSAITQSLSAAGPTFVTSALSILFVINLLLGTFNLLPVPPLDGHSGIMLLMPEGLALRYLDFVREGSFALIGLLIAWQAYGYIFGFVFPLALRLLYPGVLYS